MTGDKTGRRPAALPGAAAAACAWTVLALPAAAGPGTAPGGAAGYGYYDHMMGGWGAWLFGPVMMILFFALLVGAVMLIVRLFEGGGRSTRNSDALRILDERFARGEIDRAEYEERRAALNG